MDSDDIALPHRIEAQLSFLEAHDNILAVGSQFHSDYGISMRPSDYEDIKISLLKNNVFLHPSLLIRKNTLDEINGYNESYLYSSDYNLVCDISLKGKIINMNDILMKYRIHDSQISSKHFYQQKHYADLVRKNYICNIGFTINEDETNLFNKVIHNMQLSDIEKITFKELSNEIIKQNRKIKFFDDNLLKNFFNTYL